MSQIISFSADKEFAAEFDKLIEKSGYKNRSRFIRDAALFFAESQQRGDLFNMDDNLEVEGHLVVYYQHGSDQKLMVSRTDSIEVAAYHHSSRLPLMWSMSKVKQNMFELFLSNFRTPLTWTK